MLVNITELAMPWDTAYLTEFLAVLEGELKDWHECWERFQKWHPDPGEMHNQLDIKANLEHQIGQLKTVLTNRGILIPAIGKEKMGETHDTENTGTIGTIQSV
jgi:hypothetical protein